MSVTSGKSWWSSVPRESERPRRVTVRRTGPLLVEGPVEVVLEDGSVVCSRRFTVAICTCRRSRAYPWCDTSHRRRVGTAETRSDEQRPDERRPDEGKAEP
ncbi:CDGSH iron-sulfur domain-containing protein [Streptomyces sp. NPDC004749]